MPLILSSQIYNMASGNFGHKELCGLSCPISSFTEESEIHNLRSLPWGLRQLRDSRRPTFLNQAQWPSYWALITFLPLQTTLLMILFSLEAKKNKKKKVRINKSMQRNIKFLRVRLSRGSMERLHQVLWFTVYNTVEHHTGSGRLGIRRFKKPG